MANSTKFVERPDPPHTNGGPFQFRIRDLLLLMLLIAVVIGMFVEPSPLLFLAVVVVGLACAYLWRKVWLKTPLADAIGVLAVLGILAALLLPAVQSSHSRRRPPCANNVKQIVLALHNYHDVYGAFPPAYIADSTGRPMHSWRVLILPFLEQKPLYDQYRFDEPWDGLNNRKLADQIIRVYSCDIDHPKPSTETSYVAIVGPDTCWPGEQTRRLDEITDGSSNTILVAEIHNSGIHWMEPRDLHILQMAPTISPASGQGISSDHPHGANVAYADGATRWLPDTTPADVFRSWINISDGVLPDPADSE